MARGDQRLDERQRKQLLAAYDAIPVTPRGRKVYGYVDTLCRNWGVTKFYVQGLVAERRKQKKEQDHA